MKIMACTAAVCLVIGLSIFTTQRSIEAEGRRTRNFLPGVLNNPQGDGDSLINKVDKLNDTLGSINKRLTRLEELSSRDSAVDSSQIMAAMAKTSEELSRVIAQLNSVASQQESLKVIPRQLQIIDQNMRVILLAKENAAPEAKPLEEDILASLEWIVQKVEENNSYFPPLYTFLGAVYTDGDPRLDIAGYPSVDKRLNEVVLRLEELQRDMSITVKNVSPHIIEPTKRPRPFDRE
ncbi:MAG: hypothetical protein PHO37_16955 [Kiritimatiellae bacterium]|nr:hypothetical protein [Kiritimatiellia bacterium]